MITSNSGCDLRPPVDTYAFKCEAKQSSLEVALTASRGAACAFIRGGRGFEAFFFIALDLVCSSAGATSDLLDLCEFDLFQATFRCDSYPVFGERERNSSGNDEI